MSNNTTGSGFGQFVPGFEFLQKLVNPAAPAAGQGMGGGMPNLGSWVAPTLNVEDLEKRIDELKAVHFWLEQNSKALSATIQAMEVQKMTLATLRDLNVNFGDFAKAGEAAADTVSKGFSGFQMPSAVEPQPEQEPVPEPAPKGSLCSQRAKAPKRQRHHKTRSIPCNGGGRCSNSFRTSRPARWKTWPSKACRLARKKRHRARRLREPPRREKRRPPPRKLQLAKKRLREPECVEAPGL
ncbi:hypothetical protein LPB072_00760 [Hydrogenophaga crassostreae]|uniref:Uncharacterized protein n=1 Tax=Hydrogenophaga crassostreae TaxID=1763535 RepID=A0A1D8NR87_9BURK|nr:hypothetical protein LPB072_00760 [Hydrogenophaga crassostreae]